MTTPTTLKRKVDKLGELNATIADLQAAAETIKKELVASGLHEIEGSRFRAVVSVFDQTRLIADKVRSFLTPKQIKLASQTVSVTKVTIYDR